jgi:hypothetical protein
MARKETKQRPTQALVRTNVITPRASPRHVRVLNKAKVVAQKAKPLMTPGAGISAAAAAALGGAIGARIVASGRLTPRQTGAALMLAGGTATYIGYRKQLPVVFGAGLGTGLSGVSLLATNTVLEISERQQKRNAVLLTPDEYYRDIEGDNQDDDILH